MYDTGARGTLHVVRISTHIAMATGDTFSRGAKLRPVAAAAAATRSAMVGIQWNFSGHEYPFLRRTSWNWQLRLQ